MRAPINLPLRSSPSIRLVVSTSSSALSMLGAQIPVLIVGAGPTGLTMALSLAKHGVKTRVIEAALSAHEAIRGTAIVPRTLELLAILGVKEEFDAVALPPLEMAIYDESTGKNIVKAFEWSQPAQDSPTVPFRNVATISQAKLEAILRNHLTASGCDVEYGKRLVGFTQDADKVTALVELSSGATESIDCLFLVAADGAKGRSRRLLDIPFVGETKEADRMVLANVNIPGFSREYWHRWGDFAKSAVALKPVEPAPLFQLGALGPTMAPGVPQDISALQAFFNSIARREDIVFQDASWITEWRANIRMTERLSSERVYLAGDAAHCHSPAGGQGINTGMQDAFNLAWKLALVLQEQASPALLSTYGAERLPVIAEMLGLSNELHALAFAHMPAVPSGSAETVDPMTRAATVLQLGVNYRWSPIVSDIRGPTESISPYGSSNPGPLRAGDRTPFFGLEGTNLFRLLGECAPKHLVLIFPREKASAEEKEPQFEQGIAKIVVVRSDTAEEGEVRSAFDIVEDKTVWVIVRPDGVLGAYLHSPIEVEAYFARLKRGGV
ncbi:FAD binding domain-containing protein [Mycena metata]|uniref:FAD binding domain-containing protein n=1 Tax=Mycena metata TaxID=1033252 RepID=A0AAD7JUF5_9AGAR|nr:FAD binding domain-containing protein [Mycena metata]